MARTLPTLQKRGAPLASATMQRARLGAVADVGDFEQALVRHRLPPLAASSVDVLQINVGKVCNQTCRHCHVDAGPDRRESMTRETMALCLAALARTTIPTLDITGGAPEMNPSFRWLVEEARGLGRHVMDRCNLTILETPSQRDLPEFFARHEVEVVCSLPHLDPARTDKQRGDDVFARSITALRRLNALGYGDGSSGLRLVLVANPTGAYLPGDQDALEASYREALARDHGVVFDQLFSLTNMPISRYLEWLVETDNLDEYLELLARSFNPAAVRGVMCRTTISVGWDGSLFDCDFNQMLDMHLHPDAPQHVRDFDLARLEARPIAVDRHCFGCTAGAGSSCGGATS
jgi:radical SAM/Cys-rich protein